jgi:HEAT repeat protein
MSPRNLTLAVAAAALMFAACLLLAQKKPSFADRSAAEWAAALNRDPVRTKDRLRAGGAQAVAVLAELLDRGENATAGEAAEVLFQISPQARNALRPLVAARRHSSLGIRYWATRALERLGPDDEETVPALIEALKDPIPSIRQCAAQALGNFGSFARPAVPELSQALQDSNTIVRLFVAAALVRLDPKQGEALALLLKEIRPDSPDEYRRCALGRLEWLGPAVAKEVPRVRALLDDPDPEIRQAAAAALRNMTKPSATGNVVPTAFRVKRQPLP